MVTFRGFIAIDINSTPEIIELENMIKNSQADVKLVEPHNIHITLKFLGDTQEHLIDDIAKCMHDVAKKNSPFPISLKGTGVFPNQNYMKVIWIGIQDMTNSITTIAKQLDYLLEPLGFMKEKRGFSPHLTIGRVKTAKNKNNLIAILNNTSNTDFASQQVTTIQLKKSDLTPSGPIYTTLRKLELTNI